MIQKMRSAFLKNLIALSLPFQALVGAYFVYAFNVIILPEWLSIVSALSLAGIYVGCAFVDAPPDRRMAVRVLAVFAMLIEAIYGSIWSFEYVLRDQIAQGASLNWQTYSYAGITGILHGAVFSATAFFAVHVIWSQRESPAYVPEATPVNSEQEELHDILLDLMDSRDQRLLTDRAGAMIDLSPETIRKAAQEMKERDGSVSIAQLARELNISYRKAYSALKGR